MTIAMKNTSTDVFAAGARLREALTHGRYIKACDGSDLVCVPSIALHMVLKDLKRREEEQCRVNTLLR